MEKTITETEKLNKKIEDLTLFAERQQGVLELYRKRFNRIKRSMTNPFSALKLIWDYYKKKHWRKYHKEVSPAEYTKWITDIEKEYQKLFVNEGWEDVTPAPGFVLIKGEDIRLNSFSIPLINKILTENPDIDMLYGDEDVYDESTGARYLPYFKPDYSPDTLMSFNYIGDFCVLRKGLLSEEEMKGNIYDIILLASERAKRIHHVPAVLFHHKKGFERFNPVICAGNDYAKEAALKRRGIKATLEMVPGFTESRVVFAVSGEPKVSVIIPSKDNYPILQKCLSSLFSVTDYRNFEVILVDNGSEDSCKVKITELLESFRREFEDISIKYLYSPMDFNFSKMCNLGAAEAEGSYLLFLNDDIEITNKTYMKRMLGAAMQEYAGAVGAKLLYPGGNIIQHDGVIDIANGPVHALHFGDDSKIYYHGRNRFDFNCAAVTGAALMVSAEKFRKVGGFNEEMAVGFNDIDLCYKLLEEGWYNIIRNDAELVHHESLSRGTDFNNDNKHKRLLREQHLLNMAHPAIIAGDPFYHPLLTQTNTDYSPAIKEF